MTIQINKEDVGIVMNAVSESMANDLKDEIQRLAKMESGFATGKYESSIQVRQTSDGFEVFSDLEYAPYLEYGTGLFVAAGHGTPGRIVPTTKKALSWIDPKTGKRVFAKSIKGMKPRFYFTKSLDLVGAQYKNDVTRKVMRFIKGQAKIELAERFEATKLVIGRAI